MDVSPWLGGKTLTNNMMLPLDAFSAEIGWRPTGPNTGQISYFLTRFPEHFNLGAAWLAEVVFSQFHASNAFQC